MTVRQLRAQSHDARPAAWSILPSYKTRPVETLWKWSHLWKRRGSYLTVGSTWAHDTQATSIDEFVWLVYLATGQGFREIVPKARTAFRPPKRTNRRRPEDARLLGLRRGPTGRGRLFGVGVCGHRPCCCCFSVFLASCFVLLNLRAHRKFETLQRPRRKAGSTRRNPLKSPVVEFSSHENLFHV